MTQVRIAQQIYDVDALLFDKDGTLLNLNTLWCPWLDAVVAQLGQASSAPTPADFDLALGVYKAEQGRVIDPTGPLAIGSMDDVLTILAQVLYQQAGYGWNDALRCVHLARMAAESALNWAEWIQPLAGVQSWIAAAQAAGLRLGVVTSDDQASALTHLKALQLDQAMSVVIGHDQVEQGKPFPQMVERACQQLGVLPERTLLFGDSNGDMQMAQAAGLLAGIGIAPEDQRSHLSAAQQVIADYTDCALLDSFSSS
ncbi:HAD-IA family hydrolase [Marinospirillum sp. MEB164]|uniref:phosphoglycolate phosphatase n=1 Tax=Marinospirillum alkalitolerans TaxID=3123374 RepID=A0ABW8PWF9_9GAMM